MRRRPRVRLQGHVDGHERGDGRAGPARLRGGQGRAHAGPHQQQERLQAAHPEDGGGRRRAEDPQAEGGLLLPRGDAHPLVEGGRVGGRARAGDVRLGGLDQEGGEGRREARRLLAVELGGLEALRGAGRRGGGPEGPRPLPDALLLPLAGRHLHELQGGLSRLLPRRGDGHRAGRGRAQARPGRRGHGHRERGGLERLPGGAQGEGPLGRQARRLRRPRGARGGDSAPAAGMRLAAMRHPPAEEPPVRHGGKAAGLQGVRVEARARGLLRGRPGALQGHLGGGRALGREGLAQGGGDLRRGRGLGPRLPGVPRGPLGEDQDQQRPGEGEPGDQEALQGRPVLPLGRVDAAPEHGVHPLGGGALGHPARLQRGVRRARLQGPRSQGGPLEGEEGGSGEEGRPDRRGDNRDLRPQEGVGFN